MSTQTQAQSRWGWRESGAAVAVGAVIAALGGVAIYAATQGNSRNFGGPTQAFGPGGGTPVGPGFQRGAISGPGPATVGATSLHGQCPTGRAGGPPPHRN
ncbi:MAG TPA: hypothetical protein VE666_15890 [Mycobacterium sp.]|nr:hypothetical protein [Mycobacterium sp.]